MAQRYTRESSNLSLEWVNRWPATTYPVPYRVRVPHSLCPATHSGRCKQEQNVQNHLTALNWAYLFLKFRLNILDMILRAYSSFVDCPRTSSCPLASVDL